MADLDPRYLEELQKALEAGIMSQQSYNTALEASKQVQERLTERAKRLTESINDARLANQTGVGQLKKLNEAIKDDIKNIRQRAVDEKDVSDQLQKLKEKYTREINNPDLAKSISSNIERMNENAKSMEFFQKVTDSVKPTFAALGKGAGDLIRGYQSGGSQIGLAAGVFETAIDAAGAASKSIAGPLGEFSKGLFMVPHPLAKVVGGLGMLVSAGASAAGVLSDLAKKAFPILKTELENNVKSFQSLSSNGALFANGLAGMIETAGNAGLTLTQFDSVVKENKNNIAALGGIGAGTIALGQNLKAAEKTVPGFRNQLLNLGYTYEEQAGLMAKVMSDMSRAGRAPTDPNVVAAATADYARNLRIIADITGEDARKKEEAAKQQAAQVEFRRKLMEIEAQSPGAYNRIMTQLQLMPQEMQQNVIEQMTIGRTINQTGAILESQSDAFRQGVEGFVASAKSGMTNQEQVQQMLGRSMDQFREEVKGGQFAAIGIAGIAGHLGDVNKALTNMILTSDNFTEEGIKRAQKQAKEQQETEDKRTQAMNKVIVTTQMMALEIQTAILDSGIMTGFADMVQATSQALIDMIKALKGETERTTGGGRPANSTTDSTPLAQTGGPITSGNIARVIQGPQAEVDKFGPASRAKTPRETLQSLGISQDAVVDFDRENGRSIIILKDGRRIDNQTGKFVNEKNEPIEPTAPTTQTPTMPVQPEQPATAAPPPGPQSNLQPGGRLSRYARPVNPNQGPVATMPVPESKPEETPATRTATLETTDSITPATATQPRSESKILESLIEKLVETSEQQQRTLESIERHTQQTAYAG